jgi:hypothetical protein
MTLEENKTDRLLADCAVDKTETTNLEMRISFRDAYNVRTLDMRTTDRVVNRTKMIHKNIAQNETTTSEALVIIRAIALVLLHFHARMKRTASARDDSMVTLLGNVFRQFILSADEFTSLVVVKARIVGFLIQGHEKKILFIRLLRSAQQARITE